MNKSSSSGVSVLLSRSYIHFASQKPGTIEDSSELSTTLNIIVL